MRVQFIYNLQIHRFKKIHLNSKAVNLAVDTVRINLFQVSISSVILQPILQDLKKSGAEIKQKEERVPSDHQPLN